MRMLTVVALLFAASSTALAQPGGDDAAIRRVIQQHDEARNKGDWKAVAMLFTEEADQLTSTGDWRKGRAGVEKGVAQVNATIYKGGKYSTKVTSVRMLGADHALVDTTFEIGNIAGGTRRGTTAYILAKSGGTWRIMATRSSVPVPAGASK
jgi:uncharacterized protein (TIGR02246 family)